MFELTDELLGFAGKGAILLFCYTDWCPLCPVARERLAELEPSFPAVRFAQACFDRCPCAVEMHSIIGVPTVLALLDGAPLKALPGLRPKEQYAELLTLLSAAK